MGTETIRLTAQRDEIQHEIDRLMAMLEHSEVDPSEDEADPDVVERETTMALVEALETRKGEVESALNKVETGGYGVCERCGEPIDPERLAIMPEATMCVRCKAVAERQRGAHRAPERFTPQDW
jgi:RNA polymerase-binding transcription factor DksA